MTTTTSPDLIEARFLEEEHRRVRAGLAALADTITDGHRLTRTEAADRVARTLTWLRRDILPHAAWEEAWLYPHLDATATTPWATRGLRFEHEQIRELATSLEHAFESIHEHWNSVLAFQLIVALTRLDTLISAHLAQEERFVMPLLEISEHGLEDAGVPVS